jgi:tripartite-type tricarboxylate transporter receptor subunit TctC
MTQSWGQRWKPPDPHEEGEVKMVYRIFGAVCFFVSVMGGATGAFAEFKASTVTVSIPSNIGGGYDTYGRLAARHLGQFLPGNPTMVPRNQPGAGGVVLANAMFNVAPRDGSAIAIIQGGAPFEPLFGNPRVKFDPLQFNWLISLNQAVNIGIFWHTSPVRTVKDFFTGEVLVGSSGGGTTDVYPNLLNNLAGTKFKVVKGYKGTSEAGLAMERGEVSGIIGAELSSLRATKPEWLSDNKVRIVVQVVLSKSPDLSNVPTAIDLVKDPDDRRVLELILARQEFGRPFLAPPGVPADILAVLRQAFHSMVRDPEFLADAKKLRADIVVGTGEEIEALIKKIYATPKPLVERAISELKRASGGE